MPRMTLKIRLGPLVTFEVVGDNCIEIAEALKGFDTVNEMVDAMCCDLAERVYPEGRVPGASPEQREEEES